MLLVAMKSERSLDSATVADCYRVYKDLLERYAWSVLRDWSLASDAVQNGFVAFSRFGGDVEPEARKAGCLRLSIEKQFGFEAKRVDCKEMGWIARLFRKAILPIS